MRRAGVKPGEVRGKLLEATEELIREQGSSAVSLREVARRAGVSHGAPAHYFKNKAGLLSSYTAHGLSLLREAFLESIREEEARSGKEMMRAIGLAYARFAVARPGWFELILRRDLINRGSSEFREASNASHGLLMDVLRRCVEEGSIKPQEAQMVGAACWSIVMGFGALWNSGAFTERNPDATAEAMIEPVITLFVERMMPEAADSGGLKKVS